MVGSFIAILEKDYNFIPKSVNIKSLVKTLVTILILGISLYLFQDKAPMLKAIFKHLILGVFFGFLIYSLIDGQINSTMSKLLKYPIMQYFGKISYGLYVWHMLVIATVSLFHIESSAINLVITVSLTIMVAHISYFYFEQMFLSMK